MTEVMAGAWDGVVNFVTEFEWEQGVTPFTSRRSFYSAHVVYLSALLWLQSVMKGRKTPGWVKPFSFFHNTFMALLSLAMLIGIVLGAYLEGRFSSAEAFLCKRTQPSVGLVPFTMWVFYLSKGLEFIDTFLLILRKKELIWLHKIHHLTTMGLVYHCMNSNFIADIVCSSLNCAIHVIMYGYFAKPVSVIRPLITSGQIVQFILCLAYMGNTLYHEAVPGAGDCEGDLFGNIYGVSIYVLYLGMFVNFFVQQYLRSGRKRAAARAAAQAKDAAAGPPQRVLIDGRVYDITEFVGRHPGGRVIRFAAGTDASAAFAQFHLRSGKARKYLAALPSEADDGTFLRDVVPHAPSGVDRADLLRDFLELYDKLRAEGWFDPAPLHVAYRLAELAVMAVAGFYVTLLTPYWPVGAAILGITSGRCGWFMHEAGHYSLTGHIPLDRFLQVVTYGIGSGMSACYWRNQHNKHHATPQKVDHDTDLQTLPLVAFNKTVLSGARLPKAVRAYWIGLQAYLFAPVTCLVVTLGWQFYQHPRHSFRVGAYGELACYAFRYAAWYGIFSHFGWSVAAMMGAYVAVNYVGGMYIFTNFAVSHTHLGVSAAEDKGVTWIEYASDYTINCSNHWMVNWWMSYLNFQIEHHLFPSMPQYRFTRLSPTIRKFFHDHGLKYDCRGYFEALGDTFSNLNQVAKAA
eukprot:CAMPEP_0119131892 /NCGR_PEP_ID=MMETSP1310-20130426/10849_1 /TAXON_ID=464262 /ORGANISM="Genus nov. species nov., Strain RCC2339" /LENGTH=685 /DNA_ID=CAMNT_0007122489 /DNA_START=115 /DNA_END=2172 /DNA_ORIENTATION=+